MKVHVKHAMHNKAVSYCKQRTWCRRGDSNPHELPHTPLKRARLPVPPLRHEVSFRGPGYYSRKDFKKLILLTRRR